MRVLRVFAILLLLQLSILFLATSCCDELYTYQWSSLFVYNLDNRGENPQFSEETRFPAIAYGIGLSLDFELVHNQPCFNGLVNSAYATSCEESYTPNDTISDIRIYALSDFDESHPAGTPLSDYFAADKRRYVASYSSREEKLAQAVPISSFIEDHQQNNFYLFTDFDLFLLREPTLDSVFQFVVEVELVSQTVLIDTTESVILY